MSDAANLRGLHYMPLEVARLKESKAWLACKRRPELAFYMLNLWMAAWHSIPAGTLEDDEDLLCDKAGCQIDHWPEVRDDVMRNWVKGDDGRLHHPVVIEKVQIALEYRAKQQNAAAARWKPKPDDAARPDAAAYATAKPRQSRTSAAAVQGAMQVDGYGYGDGEGQGDGKDQGQLLPGAGAPEAGDKATRSATWQAFSEAYAMRYGVEPIRNAQVNAAIANLVKRVGNEAPAVARWYVGSSDAFYVQKAHAVEYMARDAQRLVTEMRTGRRISATAARKADDVGATVDAGEAVLNRMKGRVSRGTAND